MLYLICQACNHIGGLYAVVVSNEAGSMTSKSVTINTVMGVGICMTPTVIIGGVTGSTYEIDFINAIGPTNAWNALATVVVTNQPQLYFDASGINQPKKILSANADQLRFAVLSLDGDGDPEPAIGGEVQGGITAGEPCQERSHMWYPVYGDRLPSAYWPQAIAGYWRVSGGAVVQSGA